MAISRILGLRGRARIFTGGRAEARRPGLAPPGRRRRLMTYWFFCLRPPVCGRAGGGAPRDQLMRRPGLRRAAPAGVGSPAGWRGLFNSSLSSWAWIQDWWRTGDCAIVKVFSVCCQPWPKNKGVKPVSLQTWIQTKDLTSQMSWSLPASLFMCSEAKHWNMYGWHQSADCSREEESSKRSTGYIRKTWNQLLDKYGIQFSIILYIICMAMALISWHVSTYTRRCSIITRLAKNSKEVCIHMS